jgi:hypothetical protein
MRTFMPRSTISALALSNTFVALLSAGCAPHLTPAVGEKRVVLWRGATLRGTGGARADLAERAVVQATHVHKGKCRVKVAGAVTVEGAVACDRLGYVASRPAPVHVTPDGPVRLVVNGGELLRPRERRGAWIRVAGEAHEPFEGWVREAALGTSTLDQWLEPGLTHLPWVCENGGVVHDRPGGVFLIWIPGPACRVRWIAEKEGWVQIAYADQRVRVNGWVRADELEPDREARFHVGARLMRVARRTDLFAKPASTRAFGSLDEGIRVWASTSLRGRTLVQARGARADVVGWVDANALSP